MLGDRDNCNGASLLDPSTSLTSVVQVIGTRPPLTLHSIPSLSLSTAYSSCNRVPLSRSSSPCSSVCAVPTFASYRARAEAALFAASVHRRAVCASPACFARCTNRSYRSCLSVSCLMCDRVEEAIQAGLGVVCGIADCKRSMRSRRYARLPATRSSEVGQRSPRKCRASAMTGEHSVPIAGAGECG